MDNIQDISKQPIIEWGGQTVITTTQLAQVYEASEQQIQQNFNNHKDNFISGKHYYFLQGEELREFKNQFDNIEVVGKRASQLYLWTERGANRHCKILDTDKAWEQFDNLEETYFKVKQATIDRTQLSPQTQALMALTESIAKTELEQKRQAEKLEQQEKHIEKLEQTQEAIADTFQKVDDVEDFQKWANNRIAQIAESPKFDKGYGKKMNYAFARTESYERLKQKRNCRLDDRVEKAVGRAVKERPDIKKSDLQKINKIYIIANDKDLKPAYELVIKEMMVYYCVGGGQK